jgi:hypothetical protein
MKWLKRSGSSKTTQRRELGLILLTPVLHDDQVSSVGPDIVAIHGICGDPLKTWTHPNNTLWLRDLLPKAIAGARVFSFGYDAEVALTKAKGKIEDFARSLLNHLEAKRSDEVQFSVLESQVYKYFVLAANMLKSLRFRPLIFICHSMGGIVLKKV